MKAEAKRVRAESAVGHIRTTAALPLDLHRRLMHASVETRLVATEIIRRAVAEWLDRYERKQRRART